MDNRILPNGIISGLLFGAFMGILSWSWIIFLISGIVFGSVMGVFAYFVARKSKPIEKELFKDEKVIRSGLANHFVGAEGVGGILYLTNKQLLHKPHNINFQKAVAAYPLNTISNAKPSFTMKFIPNGLIVTLHDGRNERFVVNGRKKWSQAINQINRAT